MMTLPETYKAFTKLFEEPKEYTLPPYGKHDHRIPLKEGKDPTCKKIYAMSEKESQALRQYITKELEKGNIQPSKSPVGHRVLFVPKKDGSL